MVVASGSAPVRAVLFLVLAGLSVTSLMLGSSSLERGLQGMRGGRKPLVVRALYWFTTSLVALSTAVVIGAVLTLLWSSVDPFKTTR